MTPLEMKVTLQVLFRQEATSYRTHDYMELLKPNDRRMVDPTKGPAVEDANIAYCASENPVEVAYYVGQEHPSAEEASPQGLFQVQWREVMCEWAYNLVDHFDLPRERVSVGMNLVDRYLYKYIVLSKAPGKMNKRRFQLLYLTCMYLSIKLDGPNCLFIESMMQLGRGIQRQEIVQMEQEILFRLDWHVHPPTPYIFLRHYLLLLDSERLQWELLELAKFYLELSVLDYQFVRHPPSRIAMAAILNALQDHLPTQFSKYYTILSTLVPNGDIETVQKCRKRLYYLFCEGRGWDDTSSSDSFSTGETTTPSPSTDCRSPVHTGSVKRLRCVT